MNFIWVIVINVLPLSDLETDERFFIYQKSMRENVSVINEIWSKNVIAV